MSLGLQDVNYFNGTVKHIAAVYTLQTRNLRKPNTRGIRATAVRV